MRNDLYALPWAKGQFLVVDNYLEAAGAVCALKAGLAIESVRRPILPADVEYVGSDEADQTETIRANGKLEDMDAAK